MTDLGLVARSEKMPPNGGRIEGASMLGGRLSLASLLVRESVQNTWDARDDERGDRPVLFEMHGMKLLGEELDHIRGLLPVKDLKGFGRRSLNSQEVGTLHPQAALESDDLSILIVADRNTVGLCGPTRSGLRWDPVRRGRQLNRGQQRFANFIRNSGRASTDMKHGDGGAFGVGKSALWMASQCGTILVHSRTTDHQGNPTQRFIASIHGDHFFDGEHEYTGRHFVGIEDGQVIEPLVGAAAEEAARGLKLPSYEYDGEQVDGTTVVIVAPRISFDWQTEMLRIRDAVRWQVWPKLVAGARPSAGGRPDMEVRLRWNNNEISVPNPLDDPEIRPYAKTLLECVNERRSDEVERDIEVRCGRPKKLLGHLKFRSGGVPDANAFHLTMSEESLLASAEVADGRDSSTVDAEPTVNFERPWGQIAWIRRDPLLLVKYDAIGGPEAAGEEVGVFLSADDPDVEESLTKAEPPAHDDWIFQSVPKDHPQDHRKTFAKKTIQEISRGKRGLLASYRSADPGTQGGGERYVSQQISDRLVGGLGGGLAPRGASPSRGGTAKGPRATLSLVRTDQDGSESLHELEVRFDGMGPTPVPARVEASGTGRDSTGAMAVDGLLSFEWLGPDGRLVPGPELAGAFGDGSRATLVVRVTGQLRVRPRVTVEVLDGP